MPRAATWALGLAGSVLIHAGAAGLYLTTRTLDDPPRQSGPESRFQLDTVTTAAQQAAAQDPQADQATEGQAEGSTVPAGTVPSLRARPLSPPTVKQSGASTAGNRLTATDPAVAPIAEVTASHTSTVAFAPPTSATITGTAPPAPTVAPVDPRPAPLRPTPAPDMQIAALSPTAQDAAAADTSGAAAIETALPATSAKAALAWQFGDRVVTDPQALATIQAFMAPQVLNDADAVRDDLGAVLASVDCARLSATFLPDSGVLEMRGHIPDPALRGPILEALQAQVGDGVPVTANLLHLPAPQCGALTGIADLGLPQSTDQFTNARLIGETAHARQYTYAEGQRLAFDLTAPDYDAFVYVDYFNAAGEVIHLVPNETIALERSPAKSLFGIGQDRGDRPSLRITIGPPYGQEIAVAFAASTPLYDGLRPIVEPAEPYLDWLQTRVAAARAADPDFKGEWVYFFITTRPATQ
ncbi:DUF4384 domain-containing protein [uncultured Tateyamaria sp.]|uniref:DUF4384 domain-containing protein n=1 Tax=uncultured Tateyamaria sp. TaxID=455651 RepID=UPI0026192F6C|nr:DUF4384 domain-containing protein [uncultured Tateyamaria sp.]